MSLSRRGFLGRSAVAGAGIALVGSTEMLLAPGASAAPGTGNGHGKPNRPEYGYGPVVADPAGKLALPAGFSYQIVTQAGVTKLESGQFTPSNHDGTGAFHLPGGGTVLVNNHELGASAGLEFPVPALDGFTYDPALGGGCTVVEVDKHGRRTREYVGVAGTASNCAGGKTPWDTWLTCEETETLAGQSGATKDHGYVFEVDPYDRRANRDPKPIKALGRFAHEAAAVDPWRGDIYLTEDAGNPNGLFYRWEPPRGYRGGRGRLGRLGDTDGTFSAMKCFDARGNHVDDLSRATEIGTRYDVKWIEVPDRDARTTSVRKQFTNSDITRGRKIEGIWWGNGGAYVVTSFARAESPGTPHDGQVWFYDPNRRRITLKLRFGVNPTPDVDGPFDGPDNISVSPHGGVILAEDGEGVQHLVGATSDNRSYPIARNDLNDSEFTGPTYSQNGKILFANIQTPGIMFAITGPWRHHSEL
ncbi:PhoX family protein [Yinghuangia sp. ASG 101]|uniref:alkaline phosphatase PhoX n=1 Tax=Yinghuangia sp. ASG 101 TaxID=2896848 RepID=UPI001E2A0802|nr:alkaline phosphatase PhoX [Yinghuangia sp. ASG 101]UGQ09475.1 PhoX family protein [Yinghuangia sp. ASG 101]